MTLRFTNNASGNLNTPINNTTTIIPLQPGQGSMFPMPAVGDNFYATIFDGSGLFEIVLASARTNDAITVQRGQDGTSGRTWGAGTRFELRTNAAVLNSFFQKTGGQITGNVDLNNNIIFNARFGANALFTGGINAQTIRGLSDLSSNQIVILNNGSSVQIGDPGSIVLTRRSLKDLIFMFNGLESDVALPFTLCNGNNGTPDLRDRFVRASGPIYTPGQFAPDTVDPNGMRTGISGVHTHGGGDTGGTVLEIRHMPAHTHRVTGRQTSSNNTGTATAGTTGTTIADDTTSSTGGGDSHSHTITSAGGHTHNVPDPFYYVLAFVMFHPSSI